MLSLPRLAVEHGIRLRTLLGRIGRGWSREILFSPVRRRGDPVVNKRRPGRNMAVITKKRMARLLADSANLLRVTIERDEAQANLRELLSRPLFQEEEPPVVLQVVRPDAPAVAAVAEARAPRANITIRTPSLTLHRKPYSPITLAFNGERLRLSDWSRRLRIAYSTLYYRYRLGWSDVQILSTRPGMAPRQSRLIFYRNAV